MTVKGLFLIRHAPTPYNEPGHERLRGQRDVPVTAEGREVAARRAQFFKEQGVDVKKIYSDDLKRDQAMAEAIQKVTGAKIIADPRLKPWNMGELQGEPSKEADEDIYRYMTKDPGVAIPKGESFNTFKKRWISFLDEMAKESGDVVITHLRNLIVAEAWADAGEHGVDVKVPDPRKLTMFKKIEIALLTPTDGFIIMQAATSEEEMVSK